MKHILAILFYIIPCICFSQVKELQTFRFANMEWMTENLNVDRFLNGDLIPYAKNAAEWKQAAENKTPSWCYINDDPLTNKYGKLYNWYAVNDPRGLSVSKEYKIPSVLEWELLIHYMSYLEKVNFCTENRDFFMDTASKYPFELSPIFNSFHDCTRKPDGSFNLLEGAHNMWWCKNGKASSSTWYCSAQQGFWYAYKSKNEDSEYRGWGARILLLKYLKED